MASKQALLIGINYKGTPAELYGCIFDIIQIQSLLIDVYGFDPRNIVCLRDDDPSNPPTAARIRQEMKNLVAKNAAYNVLFYSGHGTSIADKSKDESDSADECIVPVDYATAGILTDDEMNTILKPIQGTGLAFFDCCRSGTILDLPFNEVNTKSNTVKTGAFLCFSGCEDHDVSAETVSEVTGLPQGAMTASLLNVLRTEKYYPTVYSLVRRLRDDLKRRGFTQVPQLSSTQEITLLTPFPLPKDPTSVILAQENATLKQQIQDLSKQIADLRKVTTTMQQITNENTSLKKQVQDLSKQVADLRKAAAVTVSKKQLLKK